MSKAAIVTVLTLVGLFVTGFGGFFVFLIGAMRASRKGYQPGIISVVSLAGMGLGPGVSIFFMAYQSAAAFALAPLAFLLPPALLLLMLPRRKPRRIFSVQRVTFPYATVGQAIFVIGCVATAILSLLAWWTGEPVSLALIILVIGPLMAFQFKYLFTTVLGQPVRAVTSFSDVLATAPRPPVIFMRAFEREGQTFVHGDLSKYRRYSQAPRLSGKQTTVHISLDEYLKPEIERRIGPFLALGNPQDYFTPAGAVRAYFKDETWMNEFRELAQRAVCLLVEAGESSNLQWELHYLRQSNLHDRLVVVVGHPTNPYGSPWIRLASRMAGVPQVSWDRFAATLREFGYEVPHGEPEIGSVIGFDSDARAHVLTSDADLPDEFVEPIEIWLESHRDLGRCVEVACTKCARTVFKRSVTPPATFVCHTCRAGSPVTRAALDVLKWTAAILALPAFIGILMIPNFLGWEGAWVTYAWLAFVVIGGAVLWRIASAVRRRLADRVGSSASAAAGRH